MFPNGGPQVMDIPQNPQVAVPPQANPGWLQACLAAKAMGGDVHGQC